MAKYSANPLRLLDKLYNFVGGERNRSELDLASPIVRVHDLSREAELGTYVGTEDGLVSQSFPFFTINVDNVHGGADTQIQQLGVYANQSPTWALATWQAPDPNLETIWILRAWATSSGSSMTECQILLDYLPKAGAGSGQSPFGNIFFADGSMVAATDSQRQMNQGDVRSALPPLLPCPVPITNKLLNGLPLEFITVSGGPMNMDMYVFCMRLPVGIFPPGLR